MIILHYKKMSKLLKMITKLFFDRFIIHTMVDYLLKDLPSPPLELWTLALFLRLLWGLWCFRVDPSLWAPGLLCVMQARTTFIKVAPRLPILDSTMEWSRAMPHDLQAFPKSFQIKTDKVSQSHSEDKNHNCTQVICIQVTHIQRRNRVDVS